MLLDDLLRLTFPVRDLYERARCEGADPRICHLRPLFETHYIEQLRLVDVIVDRICALERSMDPSAPTVTQGTEPACVRGYAAPDRLLCDLLDAHALVLSAADTAGANCLQTDAPADGDFAIGRVVLTNDLQRHSVREQLLVLQV